ncbi:MAG: helix-turn-helix family protein [Rhodocyclales bacterium]|nr:helix-turn-helix family protein [Rhodocyclales bacterium]
MPSLSRNHHRDPLLVAFGEEVRRIRLEHGISQEQLALMTGLDRSYMGGVERGDSNVTLLKMHAVAQALGLSLAELMRKAKL